MSSLGWVLYQYDLCPYRKGKFGRRYEQREEKKAIYKSRREISEETILPTT